MRILFLSQRVPFPPNRGDKIPTYHYVKHLSQQHEVTVACLAQGAEDLAHAESLRSLVHAVDAVPLSTSRARIRALAALAGTRPLTQAYFDEPKLRECVHRRMKSGVDAIVVFSSGVAQFVDKFTKVPRVIQLADLDSQKWVHYAEHACWPKSVIYRAEARRMLEYERRVAANYSRTLVCAPRELADCTHLIPGTTVECLPNGVNLKYFQPAAAGNQEDILVFTGVMSYPPNVDAVVWFCREVLPLVRSVRPNVKFVICGSAPVRAVRSLASEPGVTVTGAVADVRPILAQASVAVIPLRIARGIQNKLLEAMAMGLPIVTTPAACAGIDAEPGRDFLVAASPKEFSAAIVRLLSGKELRTKIGQAARAAVESAYRWDATLARLDQILDEVVSIHRTAVPVQCTAVKV